jgi:hypothetical protein
VSLRVVPVKFRDACAFVEAWHRHNKPPQGMVFCLGAADENDTLVAVCIAARPTARHYQDGLTLEVSRTATDGTSNANSMLYGAAWRAAKALGYHRLITYTQAEETGASLRAAGWRVIGQRTPRKGWSTPSRPRDNGSYLSTTRTLWEAS